MPRPDFPKTVLEFQRQFSTEDACLRYLTDSRWPDGFICPRCQCREAYWKAPRKLFQCKVCGYQASVTAGTVLHRSKMPLVQWFWAAYLVTTHTPGLSALQFARQMDMNYETAFLMLHKLRAAMVKEGQDRLRGVLEVDETYIGGARPGKGGRGAYGKVLVAGAVEVRGRRAGRIRLRVVRGVSAEQLTGFVKATVEEGSTVLTDGWHSYSGLTAMGYQHKPEIEGKRERAMEILPLIHLAFSNLKTWLLGTHHGSVKKQHMQAYLNEFTFRFNRRRTPMAAFQTVLGLIAERKGPTYAGLYDVVRGGDSWQHPNTTAWAVGS